MQAPLKERYYADADAAVVTLSATGELGDGISCSVRTGSALASAGLHPATGGDGSLLCSGRIQPLCLWVPKTRFATRSSALRRLPTASGLRRAVNLRQPGAVRAGADG